MHVGVCELTLRMAGNRSLKEKRHVVRSVLDRVTQRFRTNIAEVEAQDEYDRAVFGFAVVGSDPALLDSRVREILDFIDDLCVGVLSDHDHEILSW